MIKHVVDIYLWAVTSEAEKIVAAKPRAGHQLVGECSDETISHLFYAVSCVLTVSQAYIIV